MTESASRWRRRLAVAVAAVSVMILAPAIPVDAQPELSAEDLTRWVNPYVGTKKGTGTGLTHPGAVVPFGMVSWGPDTVTAQPGGYAYDDNRLRGFSLTHLSGAGCTIYQDIPFLPFAGDVTTSPATDAARYQATFDHANEQASPGRYGVRLDSGIDVRFAATQRSGVGRLGFPAGKPATLLVNTAGSVNGVTDASIDIGTNTISGSATSGSFCGYPHSYKVYFHATFDRPFQTVGTWKDGVVTAGQASATGQRSGGYVMFEPGRIVDVQVGLSFVSVDGARANAAAEAGQRSFDDVAARAEAAWNDRLNRIRVGGGTDAQRTAFYTALYHSLVHPNVFSDADGRYPGFDNEIHDAGPGHAVYTNISGWDIYRSEFPLLSMIAPAEASDMVRSMVAFAEQSGSWDRWTIANAHTGVMNGDPYHVLVASAHAFGAKDFDAAEALRLMVAGATEPTQGYEERPGLAGYQEHGYVPDGAPAVWGSAATTLEYTTADFAIADLARRLGDTATATRFSERSQYWQNLFNPATGYLQPRNADGSFRQPFAPVSGEGWVEGNSAQYSWMVPQNPRGLIDAMGGNAEANRRLDSFFTELNAGPERPYAWLGNEPIMHTPWLYDYSGAPYKTQQVVRRAMTELFSARPDGLAGNDDLGQMSSWYVWAALGMYPVTPGRAELTVNGPSFSEVAISRPSGETVRIKAYGSGPYIAAMRVNGRDTTRTWLPASIVTRGGTVEYLMSATPKPSWGSAPADAPPSYRDGEAPRRGYVQPGRNVLPAGTSGTAEVGVRDFSGRAAAVAWSASPPPGISVSPSSGAITVPGDRAGGIRVTVRVAAGTPEAAYRVPVAFTAADGTALPGNAIQVLVGDPGGLRAAFGNVAVCPDANQSVASFDPLWNYSAEALAAAGVTPGATVTVDGLAHTWPNVGVGEPDNAISAGQAVHVSAPGATRLALLGSATGGPASGSLTITYTDGSTQRAEVGLSDWTMSGGVGFGNRVAVSTPYRNSLYGFTVPVPVHVYATAPIALTSGKTVRTVTLPAEVSGGAMHIFAVTAG